MKAPLEMPTSGASQQEFEPQRVDYGAPEASGRIGGVQAGFPLWMGVWTIGRIGAAKSDDFRAFMLELRGATRRFLGRDLGRPYPKEHIGGFAGMTRAGGGAFDGTALDWSETINADGDSEVTLTGLPAGLVLSTGDYIGFTWAATDDDVAGLDWHAPVRIIRDGGGTADGTGEVTVKSEPPIPSAVPGSATAYLNQPACVMALIADKTKLDAIDRRLAVRGGTIAGIQDIRA